ncbi:hypothetical protein [Legionella sp.]|uniref:hypothetical protein n=1 Tax=Legionella sp. TaxID=459 RepID=UPI003C8FCE02
MNKIMALLFILSSTPLFADVHVNGYQKNNGTYVQPSMRSSPNNTKQDNWSTQGNVNPYTGKEGTKSPY